MMAAHVSSIQTAAIVVQGAERAPQIISLFLDRPRISSFSSASCINVNRSVCTVEAGAIQTFSKGFNTKAAACHIAEKRVQ